MIALFLLPLVALLLFPYSAAFSRELPDNESIHFYSKNAGDLTDPDTWGSEPDGSGAAPESFDIDMATYNVINRDSATLEGEWQVGGLETLVVIGDGENRVTMLVNGTITAPVTVENNASIELYNHVIPEFRELKNGSTVVFSGDATLIPYYSFYNLTLNNIDPVFVGYGEIGIRGNLALNGTVKMPDARGNHRYDLHFSGDSDQLISGNGNVARGYNVTFNKPAGRVNFSAERGSTILSSDNQIILSMGPEAYFEDNGIDIYAGNSVNIDGSPQSYNFTGTLILADFHEGIVYGSGSGNNFNVRDSNNNNSNPAASFNNIIVSAGNSDGEFRFRDGTLNELKIKGDFIVRSVASGRIIFYDNTIKIGGDFIIEEGFAGTIAPVEKLVFEGPVAQRLVSNETLQVNDLVIRNPQNLSVFGEILINHNLHFDSGKILVKEGGMPVLGTTANISGYSSQSFIDGPMGVMMNNTATEERVFPVGKDGIYTPLTIEVSHHNNNFVLYKAELFTSPPPFHELPETLQEIISNYHYRLDISGNYMINTAMASIPVDPELIGFDSGLLRIAKSEHAAWVDLGGKVEGGQISSTMPFTGSGLLALARRLPEVSITASAGPGGTIEPEGTFTAFAPAGKSYYIDAEEGYHIENIFINGNPLPNAPGHFTYSHTFRNLLESKTIHVEFASSAYLDVTVFPNPASDVLHVQFKQNIEHVAIISLVNIEGKVLRERTLAPGTDDSGYISLDGIEPGIYVVIIDYGQYRINKKVIILRES